MLKTQPLSENKDFRRLYAKGKSKACSVVVVYFMKNRFATNRLGITASTKIGCAVKRNRARRIITAAYSALEPKLKNGYDFVLVARGKTPYMKSTIIATELNKIFAEFNLINEG